jgi:hypothetical protein
MARKLGNAESIDRMIYWVLAELCRNDPDVETSPGCVNWGNVGDGSDVKCPGAKCLDRARAAADIGPFNLERQLGNFTGELQRPLRRRIADDEPGVGGHLRRKRSIRSQLLGRTR